MSVEKGQRIGGHLFLSFIFLKNKVIRQQMVPEFDEQKLDLF